MFVSLKESKQDRVALLGPLQTDSFQMLMKAILRLAERFPRDRHMVIYAFLKHPNRPGKPCSA
jgi:hypothetical protein